MVEADVKEGMKAVKKAERKRDTLLRRRDKLNAQIAVADEAVAQAKYNVKTAIGD